MQWQLRHMLMGTCCGLLLGGAAMAVHGHVHSAAHSAPHDPDLLSITGSPSQLAGRAERLAAHVCEVIDAGADCRLVSTASTASAELLALQGEYSQGQRDLHLALVGGRASSEDRDQIVAAQLALVEQSSQRYLRFLADAADSLTPEQKRRFNH
ncbi:hypothetical protein [Pseudomarimonas arenosa]|uniref:DUF4142 domain-containing protein n=1 Tax=Pseudomarimonas arenosa TaxID=2774145 RepID=A0AAW3ZL64_9GAMM|nr:hypothetical protein [Pseudomarimonas arenosa]MBD8526878.1 hypothetical protein [Pseudomarimonas arenosa]